LRTTKHKSRSALSGAASLTRKVSALNKWRDSLNPLRGLTIARAIALGEQYLRGEMTDLQWTYFHVEQTDPDLIALLELRIGRLLQMDYDIVSDKDADRVLAAEQKQSLAEHYAAIDNLYDVFEHLGMVPFRGFAHCEKYRAPDGTINHLEIVDQWNAVRDGRTGPWKYNPDARSISYAALPDENIMPPGDFVFRQVPRPINRYALLKSVRGGLAEKDWDGCLEIYGIPGGVLIGPPNLSEEREEEFRAAAGEIAEGGSGYAPHGSDWKPNVAGRSNAPFKERLDWLSEKLVLAGTGGKLTMLNGPTGLGGGQSEVHEAVFNTISGGDARRISEVLDRQLGCQWLDEDFPGRPHVAMLKLAANKEPDVGDVIDHIAKLSSAGYQVDAAEVSEKTGYTVTLKAPDSPPDPSGLAPAALLRNRAAAGRAALFRAEAVARVAESRRAALAPVLGRLAEFDARSDEAARRAALEKFRSEELPALGRKVLAAAPDLAGTLAEIIGTAMVDGAAGAETPAREKPVANMSPRRAGKSRRPVDFKPSGASTPAQTPTSPSLRVCKGSASRSRKP
jgi:phage gp29-like protein